jgi:hypothetical protein
LVDQLDHYREHFAQPYLEWTTTYYSGKLNDLGDITRHSPMAILSTCLGYLEEERVRAVSFMHPDSLMPVEQAVLSHFVAPMQEWLAEAGMPGNSSIHSGLTHSCDY